MSDNYFVHPTALVDDGACIGEGTRIWHWCHIMNGAKVGKKCNIGENAFIESGVVLGNNVKVKNTVHTICFITDILIFSEELKLLEII